MSLKMTFNYRVEEAETQMNMRITPSGETASKLPADFAVSAGYSKNLDDERILSIVSTGIALSLEKLKIEHDGTAEFTREDNGQVIALKLVC